MKTLTLEFPDEVYDQAEQRAAEEGWTLPGEVIDLVRQFVERRAGIAHGSKLGQSRGADDIADECRLPNWDGHRALSVGEEVLRHARRLAKVLPGDIPTPSLGAEPDGQITFEWYRHPRWVLLVSVGPSGELYYAGLFEESDVRGREAFHDAWPEIILNLIRRATGS